MFKTIDILDKNIIDLAANNVPESNISLPVIAYHDNKLCFISFCWAGSSKQRNVPRPEHICITPIQGGAMTTIEEITGIELPTVLTAKSPNWWAMKKLCQDLDNVIKEYNTTGYFPVCKYLAYLENMIPYYSSDYYPLFAHLNKKEWNIDFLKEAAANA